MRVLLVTSEGACGIAEHSAYLKEAVERADPSIHFTLHTDLHPQSLNGLRVHEIIHLNYHAALHSQWTPTWVQKYRDGGAKVVITYHDTGVPNSQQCLDLYAVADAFVVHEPCADLPNARYWRQGIPARQSPYLVEAWRRPCVGTVGFDFPWKNYDLLREAAALAGWTTEIIAPKDGVFMHRAEVVERLTGCDATAFLYHCHNTGTSGAIRQGIAARKPVIASKFPFGRQFRDLQEDDLGRRVIRWIEPNLDQVVEALSRTIITPMDAGIVRLAERDSWAKLGAKYAALYREVVR